MNPQHLLASERELALAARVGAAGLVVAPTLFAAIWFWHPANMAPVAAKLLAVLAATMVLWATQALPVAVTALLGPALAVLVGVAPADQMFAAFGNPMIFLFFGAFVLSIAAERTRLDRWLAAKLFATERATPERTMAATALATAAISSVFSNAATTAMMVPVAKATVAKLNPRGQAVGMLNVAFSSSIGGVLTPVGTPPNLIALAALGHYGHAPLPFFHWSLVAAPMALILLVLWIALMTLVVRRERKMADLVAGQHVPDAPAAADSLAAQRGDSWLGLARGQWLTLAVIALAVAGWVAPGIAELVLGKGDWAAAALKERLPESVVAIAACALLFVLPLAPRPVAGRLVRRPVLTWAEAANLDWGTLLLFGGALSLGDQVFKTGLSTWIGDVLTHLTHVRSEAGATWLFAVASLLLSEVTSNTATATMMCPLAVMTSQQLGISPVAPTIAAGLASSLGFLMPISTAPNAIVYGTGKVPLGAMLRYGLWLDVAGALAIPPTVLAMVDSLGLR